MSGISRIQKGREDFRRPQETREVGKEIWLKDGEQMFLTSIATGEENDTFLDEIYLYTFRVGNRFTNVLKDERVDTSGVPETDASGNPVRPSHKFAFWAYVHNIIHVEKRNDDWEEIEGPAGKKMFKETVNDFRIIPLTFGRGDYIWNQLVDIYSDWGSLNKGVMRIKRTGSGMLDTSYTLAATPKDDEIPEEKRAEITELPQIKDYYFERYGNFNAPESESPVSSEDDDELF